LISYATSYTEDIKCIRFLPKERKISLEMQFFIIVVYKKDLWLFD